jgi:transcriptional regulator with XRE-family HTH domain
MGRGKSNPEKIDSLPAAVKWLRQEQRLTQEELAQAAQMSKVYVGEIERGSKYPSPEKLDQLCDALGVDMDRVRMVAKTHPWDMMLYSKDPMSSAYRVRKTPDELESLLFSAEEPLTDQSEEQAVSKSVRRSRMAGSPPPQIQTRSLSDMSMGHASFDAYSSPIPTDTESAELLAIYEKLSRNDQLTILGVARSLGKHLP